MNTLRPGLAAALCAAAFNMANAGPWEATTAQGLRLQIVQDGFRTRDAYVLERRYPDGSVDAGFGERGSVLFSMGPDNEGPAALRVDASGRAWIAGATALPDGRPRAVVLRYQPQGQVDTAWADAGRAITAPAGRDARAQDLLPLADGSALVAGLVADASGAERAAWWRLNPRGQVDLAFGTNGLWMDSSPNPAEIVELAPDGSGGAALGLRRGDGAGATLELWGLPPGGVHPTLVGTGPAPTGELRLQWDHGRWTWTRVGRVVAQTPAATAATASAGSTTAATTLRPQTAAPVAPPTARPANAGEPPHAPPTTEGTQWFDRWLGAWWPAAALLLALVAMGALVHRHRMRR